MAKPTREDIRIASKERKARILGYITAQPPLSQRMILEREGIMGPRLRELILELGEVGQRYLELQVRTPLDDMPYGLTASTAHFRQRLGDNLYHLRDRYTKTDKAAARNHVSYLTGVTSRQQIAAEQRPFNHDWKLSQIERLARELGRDPREFIISCLNS